MSETATREWIGEEELAEWLGITTRLVRQWRETEKSGGPRFYRLGYRTVRYRMADVEEWLSSRASGDPPAPEAG